MTPVRFPQHNTVLAADQPQYLLLPAHIGENPERIVTTCWGFTWRERVRLLLFGRLWLQQMTFGMPLQPQRPSVANPLVAGESAHGNHDPNEVESH